MKKILSWFRKDNVIMKLMLLFGAALLVCSCSPRVYPVQRDTVTVTNTVERIVYRDSLIEVPVPQGEASSSGDISDTTDILETDLAVSGVEIKGGKFLHWLRNKSDAVIMYPVKLPQREVETTRDSKMLVRDVQYVEKALSGWQKAMMAGGHVLLGAAVLLIVLGILKWRKVL